MKIDITFDFTYSIITAIVFMFLKKFGVIDWAWYWIISPIWITLIGFIVIFIILKILKFKGWL